MKKYLLIFSLLLFSISTFAQKIWTADLDAAPESGYYNIELDQRLIGGANASFSDLRILNADKTEVPYFERPMMPIKEVSSFESYTLKENVAKDSLNIIVVDNAKKENIERFYLLISNADVSIDISIRGTNDLKQWYIVKQRSAISNYRNSKEKDAMLIADFPKGDYKYYELTLQNNQKSPLEIKKVGRMNSSSIYGQMEEISFGRHLQKEDKNGKTVISFPDLKDTYRMSKMEVMLKTAMHYYRDAKLTDSLHHQQDYFALSSKGDNTYFFNNYKLQNSTSIELDNKNNPPLTIDAIRIFGLKRYLCAYLEKGQKYTIQIDGEKYKHPNYDIQHFQDDIAIDLPIIKTQNLVKSDQPTPQPRAQMWIENPLVLWTIIIGLGLFLTLICVKMVRKMKEEEK